MAKKYGYLEKWVHKHKLYGYWDTRFVALTDVGLMYMKDPSEKEVKLHRSIDFEVIPVPEKDCKKAHAFKICTTSGQKRDELQFHALTKEEYDQWLTAFANFRKALDEVRSKQE